MVRHGLLFGLSYSYQQDPYSENGLLFQHILVLMYYLEIKNENAFVS